MKLIMVDLHGIAHRLYYSVPQMQIDGEERGMVFAVAKTLIDLVRKEEPEFLAICADAPGKKWRHEIYPEYKAKRTPPPPELKSQLSLLPQLVHELGLPLLIKERFEADDIIAELCTSETFRGCDKLIVSSDKDLMQLVNSRTGQLDPASGKLYGNPEVAEKFGLGPYWIAEYLSIVGDSSDNVPGVEGLGEVAAKRILTGNSTAKDKAKLLAGVESHRLSQRLVTLPGEQKPELKVKLSDLVCNLGPEVASVMSDWGFPALAKEAEQIEGCWL